MTIILKMSKSTRRHDRVPFSTKINPKHLQWLRDQPEGMADILEALIQCEIDRQKNRY